MIFSVEYGHCVCKESCALLWVSGCLQLLIMLKVVVF